MKEYFSCIDFKKEEEKAVCYVKDKEQLKKAFLQFMMPFYPYYYKQLSEADFVTQHCFSQIHSACSSSLLVKSSVRDTETAIQQEFGLLSGTRTATKCTEKMESFCAMPFLVRMEL